jgi:large subunit ribosomal protein L1
MAKSGSVNFRVEKQGIIHAGIGKVSFATPDLIDNMRSFMVALFGAKPEGLKGKYVKSMHMTSSQGRSVVVDTSTIDPGNPKFMLDPEGIAKLGF